MKKRGIHGNRLLSAFFALLLALTLTIPTNYVFAAEAGPTVQVKSINLESSAVVFRFTCTASELYSLVQKGLQVKVGEKEIPYEPNYSYFGYNATGTYVKSGDGIYLYASDFAEGDNIVSLISDELTTKVGIRKKTVSENFWGKEYAIETFEVKEPENPQKPEEKKNLFLRLTGSFESKMVGEEDIDTIASASRATYIPQNVNSVKLQAALVEKAESAEQVAEADWHELSLFTKDEGAVRVNENPMLTKVVIEPDCEGVTGSYNIFTGDVILSGKPKKAGTYKVYVVFTDNDGRTATSNSVDFTVNAQDEKLIEHLTLDNCTKTADGKYIYDQDPWYMKEFGAETVTVPKDIKAWYGSHTMGTYSEIGEIISLTKGEEPKQTLVIPSGCNLTMVNCRIHSGVRVVIEDGAKLTLRQSTIEGYVDVKKGGTFSCDYVDYGENAGFIYGSTINGQLRFEDGSTMENCRIISKTNYSARDDINRRNQNPVVVVKGNVNVKGDVYVLASEAPNGSYGQTGMLVEGRLNIPEGSTVAVYGGGESSLTAKGGDAVVLDGGEITGRGNLIAIGGYGINITSDRSLMGGGAAIKGDGTIDIKNAYLEGGSSFDAQVNPVQGKLMVSNRTDITAVYGKIGGITSENYWFGTGDKNIVPKATMYFAKEKLEADKEPIVEVPTKGADVEKKEEPVANEEQHKNTEASNNEKQVTIEVPQNAGGIASATRYTEYVTAAQPEVKPAAEATEEKVLGAELEAPISAQVTGPVAQESGNITTESKTNPGIIVAIVVGALVLIVGGSFAAKSRLRRKVK
ncbi:MAG: hypothetical protein E7241_10990 [Lachnospiraceae bacterium]|nr:hypothetical protein [Lachnospiraceae bacterium]